ncbi:MAG: hypothetical protein DI543_18900, partial [Bradyrhizobium icense]
SLRADDFEAFWKPRKAALAALAADAQGKPVPLDEGEPDEGYADDDHFCTVGRAATSQRR